jgi:hypothetical protein
MATFRTSLKNQGRALPRAGSNRSARRHTRRNASWTASWDPERYAIGERRQSVVEGGERALVTGDHAADERGFYILGLVR